LETEKNQQQTREYVRPAISWEEKLDVQTLSIACNKGVNETDCMNLPPVSS
jgi:hypothetical protein